MGSLEIRGTTLEYVEHGSGDLVVFVHGSISDLRTWQYQLEVFGTRFRAVAYSRRYHWPNLSIPEGVDYSMAAQVEDLAAVLRTLGPASAHLVGNSYGAFLCLLLTVKEPRLVRTLVLEEPPVLPLFVSVPPKPQQMLKLLLSRPRTALSIMKFGASALGPAQKALQLGDLENAMRRLSHGVLGREVYERLP